ncbi:MAG: nickel-dependent hydrogenase large subunit [Hydrogenothermaceae bacterium]
MKKQISNLSLNRVEGEVELKLQKDKSGVIEDAFITAHNFRGFEYILKGKELLDALVITPRICGICGHSHLTATVNAMENLYRENGFNIEITQKVKMIRQLTQCSEIIQNHIKWFYLFVMPDFLKLDSSEKYVEYRPFTGKYWKNALNISSDIVKIIAILGGQWPHTSYSLPGGITSDPLKTDLVEALSIVDSTLKFVESNIIGMDVESYLSITDYREFMNKTSGGSLKDFIELSFKNGMEKIGKSYGHFITVSNVYPCIQEAVIKKKRCKFNIKKVKELKESSSYSIVQPVRYDGLPMETGPLARRLTSNTELFVNLNSVFSDSYLVRVWARVDEIVRILVNMKDWILKINLSEKSYIKPKDYKLLSGESFGLTEAARGSLIHKIEVYKGKILDYNIITPTIWNLGPRCKNFKGVAEKAIIGLDSDLKAQMVLRSFDVCSVCLVH